MIFRRAVQRYGQTPEPVTPYQRAAQVWDDRIGAATVHAANWRALAFGAVTVALTLSGGMVWLASQNRVTPYIVEVDKLGEVRALGPATTPYNPGDAQIAWFLARFITNIRSLSIDPVLVRQNWLDAYDFATDRAAVFLNAQAQAHDPFAGVGERSVTVSVTSVVRASPTSFQIKWQEQTYQRGVLTGTAHWTALMSVQQTTPRREDVLRKNPLGLYVNELAWSQDYAGATDASSAAALASSVSIASE
ncbi:conjugal transfer protein TrbF [Asticcacaulis sp.]|uniref:conjugal transfer protein TrbF n=1 Tax=Asticcacaulis sp. TaxID=1872648 RepID=UPI002B744486|nr:conjugal transfer protein TrbF [Asticcacaulis sp.]HTM81934.1 conjugal transfer protein TrbF [Asticcacaulis sp.]